MARPRRSTSRPPRARWPSWLRWPGPGRACSRADDVDDAASVLDPGTVGLVLVYENTWAIPFATAALGEGGQTVASSRLTVQEIMDALDAAESAD